MDRTRMITKLAFNALRYRFLKVTGRPGQLEAISLEITHRCICRCRMCNIWQIPPAVPDLPLSNWTGLLSAPELRGLRELDITGGEPFLRKDLAELICWISHAKSSRFPQLRTLAITTNGILTEQVLQVARAVIAPLRQQGIDLVLACGLDAIGPLHDDIRHFPGAWEKLAATLTGLQQLREESPNLILGIKTTIIPANLLELERIVAFAQERRLFAIISPCILTANRFGNLDLEEGLHFSRSDRQRLTAFYSGMDLTWSGHRQTMLDYLGSGKVRKPCSAGFNTLFVRHNGDAYPCPVIASRLGNIQQTPVARLLTGKQAKRFRQAIGTYPECQTCTEPGLERIACPYEGFSSLLRLRAMGFANFAQLFKNAGLEKYF